LQFARDARLEREVFLRAEPRVMMSARYLVSTEIQFSASHALRGYQGDCSRVHGHNWVVRVYCEFHDVNAEGLTVDYRALRSDLERIVLRRFDHRHLNDCPPFDSLSPTSENLAAEIFGLCRRELELPGGVVTEVELWESPTDMVRYREDE
jgi:6-pyruvoyltetrahydropterin/6-carboxytetrahydropterin synthase